MQSDLAYPDLYLSLRLGLNLAPPSSDQFRGGFSCCVKKKKKVELNECSLLDSYIWTLQIPLQFENPETAYRSISVEY